jgi:hypothetical protein
VSKFNEDAMNTASDRKVKLFESRQVRAEWDADKEAWWFSIVDIVAILTDSVNPTDYLKKLRKRDPLLGGYLGTNCPQVAMQTPTGKQRKTLAGTTEHILRLIQSIPSKKAEPFKLWLARVGNERIDESADPELSIERAIQSYRRLGYSENWINQRIKSIEIRKALTDEWDKSGVQPGQEYAALTDLMSKSWSGLTTREYKRHKGLKKESLRDNMTNTELVLNMLAEVAATDISLVRNPQGMSEAAKVAVEGAETAKAARVQLEKSTGKPVVSASRALPKPN